MAEQRTSVGGVEIVYEVMGEPSAPPIFLVMGLGAQLHYWPDGLCRELTDRNLCVVRFDNRDAGLSTHFSSAGVWEPGSSAAYTLNDMASDTAGLIETLGFPSAHLIGISLGGMIAQLTAIEHPRRVRSLTSISSTTGNPRVGAAKPEALEALFSPPKAPAREAVSEHAVALSAVIGSPGFARDEEWLRWRSGHAFDRCYDPAAASRQAGAVFTATDRTPQLRKLRIPALVIHGSADPLVDVSGGIATAEAIPGAELVVIEGMGHDLPPATWGTIADAVEQVVRRAET